MKGRVRLPENTEVKSMVEHMGTLFLATNHGIYRLENGLFYPVYFVTLPPPCPHGFSHREDCVQCGLEGRKTDRG